MTMHARGFSLLETLLVVALLAIAGVLVAGAVTGGFRGMELRGTAKEMATHLRYTRARAISTGQSQRFTVDLRTRTWSGANGREGEIPDGIAVEFTGAREVQPSESSGAIEFFPDGAATGGRIRLAIDDAAWQLDVAWLTGEVVVSRAGVDR